VTTSLYDTLVSWIKWSLFNFETLRVERGDKADNVIIRTSDDKTGHGYLEQVSNALNNFGFTVKNLGTDGEPILDPEDGFVFAIDVTLVRAEEKLGRGFVGFCPKDYPDYTNDIIATGPLTRTMGCEPRRIVLRKRKQNPGYIIHTQIIPDGVGPTCRPSFDTGDYYREDSERQDAIVRFVERMYILDKDGI
jgi:hypothetical protein